MTALDGGIECIHNARYMVKNDVIGFYGSQHEVARALGITRSAVSYWKDPLPALRQLQLERLTGGVLKADADLWKPTQPAPLHPCGAAHSGPISEPGQ